VDEEGCEAASATAAIMRLTRSAPMGPEPIELHLNVPFLYTLRDKISGVLLFLGTQTTFTGTVIDRSEL
jgi:serine protease inhibitor